MHVAGSEKIGVCGRSGAGKTSLITLLFRLMQPTSGTRGSLLCIPQVITAVHP